MSYTDERNFVYIPGPEYMYFWFRKYKVYNTDNNTLFETTVTFGDLSGGTKHVLPHEFYMVQEGT